MGRKWLSLILATLFVICIFYVIPAVTGHSQLYGASKGGKVMKAFKCGQCGFVSIDGSAPEKCPVCGAPKKMFSEMELNSKENHANYGEPEKKHIPAITINKKCGMFPDGCTDVFVKIGEITHPMLQEHHIVHIDFYIDKKFVSRQMLTADKINPAACLHIKVPKGSLQIVEMCNVHGDWINETAF